MGDSVAEIENAISNVEGIMPIFGGVISTLVPGSAEVMTLATPVLSIINEILAAIETLKGGGMSHSAAVAVIGTTVSSIGQTLSDAAPAVAPPTPPPTPHETTG